MSAQTITVTVTVDQAGDKTEARAHCDLPDGTHMGGWGRANRDPEDPEVPIIGDELAVARALSDLAHNMLEMAARQIGAHEGSPVFVHD